jgi:hypothetical protein
VAFSPPRNRRSSPRTPIKVSEWVAKVRHWAAGDGLWIGEPGGVPAGAMVLGAARPYVPTVSEPEVYGEGRTERIDERYPAARR